MSVLFPAFCAAILNNAQASPAVLATIDREVHPASGTIRIVAVTHDDGAAVLAPTPTVRVGPHAGEMEMLKPGHWAVTLPRGDGKAVFVDWGEVSQAVQIKEGGWSASKLEAPTSVEGLVGETVSFTVTEKNEKLGKLEVASPEGESQTKCDAGTCIVTWTPGDAPFPRAVPLILSDPKRPHSPPAVTIIRLAARPLIPVKTEAGAAVTLTIGDRSLGPQIAGESGEVRFRVDVQPGDKTATVQLEDTLGNRQTSTMIIGGNTGPTATVSHQGTIIEGAPWPKVWVAVSSADGSHWRGSRPVCTGLTDQGLGRIKDGLWFGIVDAQNSLDRRVSCQAGRSQPSSVLVPVDRARATRLALQMYPPQLSADIPIAEVQSYLVNGVGERLPSAGIHLEAARGVLHRDSGAETRWVRARYDGSKAALGGNDVLRAEWSRPLGQEGLWDVALATAAPGSGNSIVVDARAVDQGGRPLSGMPVTFWVSGQEQTINTGDGGWATATFDWPGRRKVVPVQVGAGGEKRFGYVLKGDRTIAGPGQPDLVNEISLQISPGRVHGVLLNTSHRTLTNDGATANVTVQLEDKLGNPINGPAVNVSVSRGKIGPVEQRGDGTFVTTLQPNPGIDPGLIRVTARTEDGQFSASTDIKVVHKLVDWSLGSRIGALITLNGDPRPYASIDYERRLPVPYLYARGSFDSYSLHAFEADPITGSQIDLRLRTYGASGGLMVRRTGIGFPVWAGARVLLAPFHQTARVGGSIASSGWGWLSPGASMTTGSGFRFLGGEAFWEVDYVFIAAPTGTIGWEGPVGGLVTAAGFKLLY